MNIWEILGLEPTEDPGAIRKAYAEQAKTYHPEEEPEGFLTLRQAYQAALDHAGRRKEARSPNRGEDNRERARTAEDHVSRESDGLREEPDQESDSQEESGWNFPEIEELPNPYEDGEAIRKFLELYCGTRRQDANAWMDYFTSDAFLDAGWEPEFTALLLEEIAQLERVILFSKECLLWLSVVYQFSVKEEIKINRETGRLETQPRQTEVRPGAEFDGLVSILSIALKGPLPKRPVRNERAMKEAFWDYRRLTRMAEGGAWDVPAMEEFKNILNRYTSFYIKDRCDPKGDPDLQRCPAGLRLLLHFFRREDLPETLYRELWRKLDLKSAVMGRGKILYGPLRELAMERVPGIAEENPENFLQLNRDHDAYRARIKEHPEREDAESAAFFDREDLQKALRSPRFVAEQLLTYTNWRRDGMGENLVRRMLCFYREHPEIPRSGEAAAGLEKDLRERVAERWNREDIQAEICPQLTLQYRPLFRHWLNTAFYTARDSETGMALLDYLRDRLPYLPEWSRGFVEQEQKHASFRTLAVCMGRVELDFYRRYIEYRVEGKPVYRPCLTWEETAGKRGDDFFWLLPLTFASWEFLDKIAEEIARRLQDTAAPEEDRAVLARCLAESVCCLPEIDDGKPEEFLIETLYAESGDRLYGCFWLNGEGTLTLFEQTASGRQRLKTAIADPNHMEDAARRLLKEVLSPTGFYLPMREAPWHIYFTELSGPEQEWTLTDPEDPEDLDHSLANAAAVLRLREEQKEQKRREAEDAIHTLLFRFGRGELRRIELSWFEGQLVFRKEPSGYACLYFEDHSYDIWYAVLSHPEVYKTVDEADVVYLPFGMGVLPNYAVHEEPGSILREVERIFAQLSEGRPKSQGTGGWLWDSHTNRQDGRHKLLMARQKLGGMPPDRARERMEARYVFSRYPAEMETLTLDAEREITEIRSGSYGKASEGLLRFMGSKLARLRLTWAVKGTDQRWSLLFFQDAGRFLLCRMEEGGDAKVCMASLETEAEPFQGRSVPAGNLHRDLRAIRNCVDLILDDADHTERVLERYFVPAGDLLRAFLNFPAENEPKT